MTQIKERLEALRQAMKNAGVAACIVPEQTHMQVSILPITGKSVYG